MKVTGTFAWIALLCASTSLSTNLRAQDGGGAPGDSNLLSWGAGALVVQAPPSYHPTGEWSPEAMLDELPGTGWATPDGDLAPKVFVLEMAEKSSITSVGFDTAKVENAGRGAKDVRVEISDNESGGFTPVGTFTLAQMKDHQRFPLRMPASGRYIRLTVLNNWGDPKYMEIMNVYAFGRPVEHRQLPDNSGTFESSFGNFHLQQNGSAVDGCYEWKNGLIENGGFEGRVLRFTWTEAPDGVRKGGPAMLIFHDDGQSFTGYWWQENEKNGPPSGSWLGKRISNDVGSCPFWKPGAMNGVVQQLAAEGRARLYGILFDTDSDHLKPESKPTLDALIAAAAAEPAWSFAIEGYTDNVGGDTHNQVLSQKRAAAVKAYLVGAGVNAGRMTAAGFGANNPVSTNDTELGRSQNRRVEVVKK